MARTAQYTVAKTSMTDNTTFAVFLQYFTTRNIAVNSNAKIPVIICLLVNSQFYAI